MFDGTDHLVIQIPGSKRRLCAVKKTANLLGEQHVLIVTVVPAFHVFFLLSTPRDVQVLRKFIVTHMLFHVRPK